MNVCHNELSSIMIILIPKMNVLLRDLKKSIGSIESKWIKRIKNTVDICRMEIFTFYLY